MGKKTLIEIAGINMGNIHFQRKTENKDAAYSILVKVAKIPAGLARNQARADCPESS